MCLSTLDPEDSLKDNKRTGYVEEEMIRHSNLQIHDTEKTKEQYTEIDVFSFKRRLLE